MPLQLEAKETLSGREDRECSTTWSVPSSRLIRRRLRTEGILISLGRIQNLLPGLALCVAIGLLSWLIDQTEVARFGYAGIEAIVLAILLGMALRNA